MNIIELKANLKRLISVEVKTSVFVAGAPGIAKSAIIKEICREDDLQLIDIRLSRLMPRDLQGLPRIDGQGYSVYAAPGYLPHSGRGILFLDEFNQAVPAMMALAQELILDRRIGDYKVPDGWFIIAAGNRKSDGAAVNQIPSAVGNRFIHFEVEPDLGVWLSHYAAIHNIDPRITSFLKFRPELFHKYDKNSLAWPSARSWDVADKILKADVSVSHSVGEAAGAEFEAYVRIFEQLPDIDAILAGKAKGGASTKPDLMFAILASLTSRFSTTKEFLNCSKWLAAYSTPEYVSSFWSDSFEKARTIKGTILYLSKALKPGSREYDSEISKFMERYKHLMEL